MPKPFPAEFRRDVIAVARKGEASMTQIARDFGISQSCLKRWLVIAAAAGEVVRLDAVEPWSAENPRLYDAVATSPGETVRLRIGFRTR